AEGGTLRVDGTIGRYTGSNVVVVKGGGILELNTGTTYFASGMQISGGSTVRAINGSGGMRNDQYSPVRLTVDRDSTFDMNGNSIYAQYPYGTGRIFNSGDNNADTLTIRCKSSSINDTYLSGTFNVNYTAEGTRTVTLANPTNNYTGSTTFPSTFSTVVTSN